MKSYSQALTPLLAPLPSLAMDELRMLPSKADLRRGIGSLSLPGHYRRHTTPTNWSQALRASLLFYPQPMWPALTLQGVQQQLRDQGKAGASPHQP